MLALRDLGFLEIEPREGGSGYGPFHITTAGREAIARFREPAAAGVAGAHSMDTSWARVRPVLVAVVQQWEQQGARDAVDTDVIAADVADEMTDAGVRRALELLEADGWLKAEYEAGTDGPIAVTPELKALQLLRDWPTRAGDTAIVGGLLDALDEAIEGASDPEEKSRLRKLRDAAGDVGKSVLAGAIVAAGKTFVGG
jgi:DNA-binding PadR family transcriptional regulator